MNHVLVAVVLQILLGPVLGWWPAGALAAWGFFMREVAQAEQRWIEAYGAGVRANLGRWTVFTDARAWTLKGVTDFVYPALVCALLPILVDFAHLVLQE